MSTAKLSDDTPLDPDDELLVAYLDGELDRKGQADLENRLLEDQKLRSRLQQLQAGWDLLDELPNPEPNLKLVESTLELVVADIVKVKPTSTSIWNRFRLPISVAGLCVAGILAAYVITWSVKARAYQQQLQDLAIVENLDAYNYGSDLTLMRLLAADPAWIQMVAASREIGDIQIEMITNVSATPAEKREQLIEKLPLEKREELNSRWERFMRFDEENRRRIRRTAEAVAQQADAEFLLQSMQAYARWRENLPTELRDKIESDDPQERRSAIKEAIEREQKSISRRSSLKLSDDAIDWIYFALRQIVQQRVNDGDEPTVRLLDRFKSFGANGMDPILGVIFSITRSESGGRGGRGFPRPGSLGGAPEQLRLDELELIRLSLPDRERDILDSVAGGHPLNEAMTLGHWAEEAARRNSPWAGRDRSTLLDRYNELPDSERERIDLLPPKEFLKHLQRDSFFRPPPPR